LKYSIVDKEFSARIFRFSLLAVLAAGLASVPFRLAAEVSAQAGQPQPAAVAQPAAPASAPTSTTEAAKPAAAQTQEEQSNAFRLEGPLVKASSKALHLSLETTARAFEVINFLIVVLGLGIPLVKFLPKVLRKRTQTLRHDIESARKLTEDANTRLSAIEAKLSGLDAEIGKIRAQVEEESKQDEVRIKSTIADESARIVAAAEQEIGVAAAQARRGLRHFAADLAIEQAAKQLVLTPEADSALISEFLVDVGAQKGGEN
jgi:F-type H+-transporting ATPase subunit b